MAFNRRVWTDEKIINCLKDIGKDNIITNKLLIEYYNKNKICHPALIRFRFDTLKIACDKANIKYQNNKGVSKWPNKRIINSIIELSKQYKTLTTTELLKLHKEGKICHPNNIRKKFNNIKELFKTYGINYTIKTYEETLGKTKGEQKRTKYSNTRTKYNKENIIQMLKNIYKENPNVKPKDINKYSKQGKLCCTPVIKKHFGTCDNLFKAAGIEYDSYYWSKERIIKCLQAINKKHGPLFKAQLNKFTKKKQLCQLHIICHKFGSLEHAAKQAGFDFVEPYEIGHVHNGKLGIKETKILNDIETQKNIKLKRQYEVQTLYGTYFIDGYDKHNNIAYEVDDKGHNAKSQYVLDRRREQHIQDTIKCEFIRIRAF